MRSRPRTPPGPPPPSSSSHRKSTHKNSSSRSHGAPSTSSSGPTSSRGPGSKMPPPRTGSDLYTFSSQPGNLRKSSYPLGSSNSSSAPRESEKHSKSSTVRKSSGKISGSDKYTLGKSDPYLEDYKPKLVGSTASYVSDPYLEKDIYTTSRYPTESKGIRSYPDKFGSVSDPYNDVNYSSVSKAKYYDPYSSYSGGTSHYPHLDNAGPYYSVGSSSGYGGYGAPYDEPVRGPAPGSYGGDKMRGGGGGGGGRMLRAQYPEDEPRNYRDYSPPPIRSARSPLSSRGGSGYNDYGHFSPPPETSDRLSRYVIGDSVVYGDKEYCPDLGGQASQGGRRPPSPPPHPLPRTYSRYADNSPRRGYGSAIKGRSPLSGVPHTPPYRSLSPLNRRPPSPSRRPPSPPSRRPLSPDSSYMRAPLRSSQVVSHEPRSRVKDSFKSRSKNPIPSSSLPRTPPREPAHTDRHRSDGKLPKEKERKRELDKRSRSRDGNNKHTRSSSSQGDRNSNSSIPRQKDSQVDIPVSKNRVDSRDVKRARPPIMRNGREGSSRDRKDDINREKDKPRRIEDRLGPTPNSVGNPRRTPVKGRVTRRPNSPTRDKKRGSFVNRRPDDLRLWIESRKNEVGSKRPQSPNRSRLPAAKRLGRAGDRNAQPGNRRPRIDPKKRLGNKARRKGLLNTRRNKILKKYGKLNAAKRGGKGDGNVKNRDYKDEGYKGKNGSSGSNRRVINKPAPKHISRVNLLPVKPRVLKKPLQKLLQDPKENDNRKYEDQQSSKATKEFTPKEEKPSIANTDVSTGNSK